MREINRHTLNLYDGPITTRAVFQMPKVEMTVFDNGRVEFVPAANGPGPVYTVLGPDEQ